MSITERVQALEEEARNFIEDLIWQYEQIIEELQNENYKLEERIEELESEK